MIKTTMMMLFLVLAACDEPKVEVPSEAPEDKVTEPVIVTDVDGWETTVDHNEPEPEPQMAFRPEPPGFPVKDQYSAHDEACLAVVMKEVPADSGWRQPILMWCEHRSYHASRNTIVKSRVDGTQIHDRDRPTAWMFYQRAVAAGHLDPDNCPFHGVNRKLRHPHKCQRLRVRWPFKDVKLSDKRKWEWATHPHDMERFGARGPHDWNASAYKHLGGCWDPAQLERFDVGITTTVRASMKICEKHGCVTKHDIKAYWGRGKRKKKQPRPDDERPIEAG